MGGVEGWDVLDVVLSSLVLVEGYRAVLGSPVDMVLGLLVVGGLEVVGGSLVTAGL